MQVYVKANYERGNIEKHVTHDQSFQKLVKVLTKRREHIILSRIVDSVFSYIYFFIEKNGKALNILKGYGGVNFIK